MKLQTKIEPQGVEFSQLEPEDLGSEFRDLKLDLDIPNLLEDVPNLLDGLKLG